SAGAGTLATLGAAGARPSEFKRRVLRLLGVEERPRLRLSRPGVIGLGIVLIASLAGPALTYPRGNHGGDKTSPQQDDITSGRTGSRDENGRQERSLLQAGGGDKERPAGLRVSGRVLDATTGKPVEECRVIPTAVYDEKTRQYTWQPQYRKTFKDGVYEWKTD